MLRLVAALAGRAARPDARRSPSASTGRPCRARRAPGSRSPCPPGPRSSALPSASTGTVPSTARALVCVGHADPRLVRRRRGLGQHLDRSRSASIFGRLPASGNRCRRRSSRRSSPAVAPSRPASGGRPSARSASGITGGLRPRPQRDRAEARDLRVAVDQLPVAEAIDPVDAAVLGLRRRRRTGSRLRSAARACRRPCTGGWSLAPFGLRERHLGRQPRQSATWRRRPRRAGSISTSEPKAWP